jgi:hypothetical protein
MMHLLISYLEYISTRPVWIVGTAAAVVCLIIYGRLTARGRHPT